MVGVDVSIECVTTSTTMGAHHYTDIQSHWHATVMCTPYGQKWIQKLQELPMAIADADGRMTWHGGMAWPACKDGSTGAELN